jgi:hypothetical protein
MGGRAGRPPRSRGSTAEGHRRPGLGLHLSRRRFRARTAAYGRLPSPATRERHSRWQRRGRPRKVLNRAAGTHPFPTSSERTDPNASDPSDLVTGSGSERIVRRMLPAR